MERNDLTTPFVLAFGNTDIRCNSRVICMSLMEPADISCCTYLDQFGVSINICRAHVQNTCITEITKSTKGAFIYFMICFGESEFISFGYRWMWRLENINIMEMTLYQIMG